MGIEKYTFTEKNNLFEKGEVDPDFEIQKTTVEDALSRAIYVGEGYASESLLKERPGYYASYQSNHGIDRDPESGKIIPGSFMRKSIKLEGYCWLVVDIDEYFAEFEKSITDPSRIFELAEKTHPSLLKLIRARGFLKQEDSIEQRKEDLITNLIGMENKNNLAITFAYEGTDENAEKLFNDLFSNRDKKIDEERQITESLVSNDSEVQIVFNQKEGRADFKSVFMDNDSGIGRFRFWLPEGLSKIGIEHPERFKKILDDIKLLIDKLKENKQVSQIHISLGTGVLSPFWKRNE
ncbi:MAG: hypothetical protein WCV73_01730 [Patescibacteria group bacterium]|jgi:hypothetical protein